MAFDSWLELLAWLDLEGQAAAAWAEEQGRVLDAAVTAFDAKRAAAAAAVDLAGAAPGDRGGYEVLSGFERLRGVG